jgi:catechol 2,3-dioxygenase-like lactoylglutathione lyase family enzyme
MTDGEVGDVAARLAAVVVGSAGPARAAAWYRDRLGLRGDGSVLEAGRARVVITERPGTSRPAPEPTRLITNFSVADVLALEAWLVESGATWARELESSPWGRIGTLLDPDGNYVQVIEDIRRAT